MAKNRFDDEEDPPAPRRPDSRRFDRVEDGPGAPRRRSGRDEPEDVFDDDAEYAPRRGRNRSSESESEEVDAKDLRQIATYQKIVIVQILIQLCVGGVQYAAIPWEILLPILIVLGLLGIVGLVFVILLSMKVYGSGSGAVIGILTLIPCIGLIILLLINQKATKMLQDNGVHVGLLGARMSDLPRE
jgi:hypothetical protein